MQGKFIVIDGIDGAGKTTQIELLSKYLTSRNIPYEVISFPRYGQNQYTENIKKYLAGQFGSLAQVDPYKIATFYAGDRALAKPLIESWLSSGKVVIANRYVSSSKAHLGANLPEDKREEFMRWLDELEYGTNVLPKPDLTVLLDADPAVAQKNVAGADIHEKDFGHLEKASKIYLELSQAEPNWKVVECMSDDGSMKSKEEIHQLILEILNSQLLS